MPNHAPHSLAPYAERLRNLHAKVRDLLPAAEQDELLELAVTVGFLALDQRQEADPPCTCGHPESRHRVDPMVCLDCWRTPTPLIDSRHHEHPFTPAGSSLGNTSG